MKEFLKNFFTFKGYPLLKKFTNAAIYFFLIASVYFFSGDPFVYSDVRLFTAVIAVLNVMFIMIPYFIYNYTRLKKKHNIKYLFSIEFFLALALVFNAFGANNLYKQGFEYDSMLHFTNSFLVTIVFLLFILGVNKKIFSSWIIPPLLAAGAIIIFGISFEFFEYYGDILFGTLMYGQLGQPYDTLIDMSFNVLGGLTASLIIVYKHKELLKNWKK